MAVKLLPVMIDRFRRTALAAAAMAALLVLPPLLLTRHSSAVAKPRTAACSDVEVVFARGTDQPPGLGREGKAFVNALRQPARWPVARCVRRRLPGDLRLPGGRQRRQRRQRPHPGHDERLPGHQDRPGRLLAGRGDRRRPRCGAVPGDRVQRAAAARCARSHRRARRLRQPERPRWVCR